MTSFTVFIYLLVVVIMALITTHQVYALPLPANNTLTTKLTDTLKSITANVSSEIDKAISDTMDITIDNAISQIMNSTTMDNNDATTIKFQPQIPSRIDVLSVSPPMSEFGSLEK